MPVLKKTVCPVNKSKKYLKDTQKNSLSPKLQLQIHKLYLEPKAPALNKKKFEPRAPALDLTKKLCSQSSSSKKIIRLKHHWNTENYWKRGWLGSSYQNYIDSLQIVNESDLDPHEKEKEKEDILSARKKAFGDGDTYLYYPPWRK